MDAKAGGKTKQKLSFCPFCQYSGSNDLAYLNHIVCTHYNMSYGCGKCLNEVLPTGQWLMAHMKCCKGLKTEVAKEKPATSWAKGASSSSSNSKKKKHKTKSQQPDLQLDSQQFYQPDLKRACTLTCTAAGATSQKLLLPLQRSHTPVAKIQRRSIP